MTIATMLSIAVSFWGGHGYALAATPTVTWDHGSAYARTGLQATAEADTNAIVIQRQWWRYASNEDRCVVVIHEVGHLLGFEHTPGTVMAEYDEDRPVPGTCKRKGWTRW